MPASLPQDSPDTRLDIEIIEVHSIRGPNRWTYRPVLEAVVDIGGLEDFPSNRIPGLAQRLEQWLPGLVEHRCSYGERGGFLRRLHEGTWPAHILEHVTVELQALAGLSNAGFGRARETSTRGVYRVVVCAVQEKTARAALAAARDLLMAAIGNRAFDVARTAAELRALNDEHYLGPSTESIVRAAENRGIPSVRLNDGNLVQIGYGAAQRRIWTAETDRTSAIAAGIALDKEITRELLDACGVPVPEGRAVADAQDAWAAAQEIGLPVVVKPRDANHGRGVFTNLLGRDEVLAAWEVARGEGSGVLVERFVRGNEHRLLVVGGRVVAATRGEPAFVVGEIDVTDHVHPDVAAMATLAADIVGLDIAGIDLVVDDVSRPLDEQGGAIVEVNAGPGLLMHLKPAVGRPRPVGEAIVDHLFPAGADGRIPIVGIAGTRSGARIAALVASLLRGDDRRIGLANADGLFVGERRIAGGDCAHWTGAHRLLKNPFVDSAVLENGARSIALEGLAYDRCSVGVVTSLERDARIDAFDVRTPEQMYTVLRTQVDVVLAGGAAVLNACDPTIAGMSALCDGETILYAASPRGDACIDAHVAKGGRAVRIEDGRVTLRRGADIGFVADEDTLDEEALDDIVPAIAAAWAAGASPQRIAERLAPLARRTAEPVGETA